MEQEGKAGQVVSMHGLIECPKCGYSNAEGVRYCDACGASLIGVVARQAEETRKAKGLLGKLRGRRNRAA